MEFDQIGALATASAQIDIALRATQLPSGRREGAIARLLRAREEDGTDDWPEAPLLQTALLARHAAVHEHKAPQPEVTRLLVSALHAAWCCLRRRVVNPERAAALACLLATSPHIKDVYMFGSLARNVHDAADIDFLVIDDGEFSSVLTVYEDPSTLFGVSAAEYLFQQTGIIDDQLRAQAQCGWFDVIALEAERFGEDYGYTRHVAAAQKDPLFFLNIGASLTRLDISRQSWVGEIPPVFEQLSEVRKSLAGLGILDFEIPREPVAPPPSRRRKRVRRKRRP